MGTAKHGPLSGFAKKQDPPCPALMAGLVWHNAIAIGSCVAPVSSSTAWIHTNSHTVGVVHNWSGRVSAWNDLLVVRMDPTMKLVPIAILLSVLGGAATAESAPAFDLPSSVERSAWP